MEHGHHGLDDRSKVRHFRKGIKGPMFDPVSLAIDTDVTLQLDYDRVVQLYSGFIKKKFPNSGGGRGHEANISEVKTAETGGTKELTLADLADVDVEDRYYTRQEYAKMSARERTKLYLLRKADGRTGPKKRKVGGSSKGGNGLDAKAQKKLKKLSRTVAVLKKKVNKTAESSDESSVEQDDKDIKKNKKNKHLTRQKN